MAEKEPKLSVSDATKIAENLGQLTPEELEKLKNHLCPGEKFVDETPEAILRHWIEHEPHPTRDLLEEKLKELTKDEPASKDEKPGLFSRFITGITERGKSIMKRAEVKDLINSCGEGKDIGRVRNLLDKVKPNVVYNRQTPLLAASLMGHLEFVKVLVLANADVNFVEEGRPGRPALNAACSRGRVEVAEYLLDQGASINATDGETWTALHEAAFNGHVEAVKLLIERGANLEKKTGDGSTALMLASSGGDVDTVELLLKNGAKSDHRIPKFGRTAIHAAASRGQHKVVKVLLKASDCNIDDQDSYGATPLIMAIRAHRRRHTTELEEKAAADLLETVKVLVEKGANLNALTKEGKTALIYAVELNLSDEAKVLVDAGADLDVQDMKNGWSAIFYAAEKVQEPIFRVLCDSGANLTLKDNKQRSLLSVAHQYSPTIHAILEPIICAYYAFDGKYPGVRFFGKKPWKEVVTSAGAHIDWMEEIGVEFEIPPGAVPDDRELELSVWPCSEGPFELPEDYELASPVYLISPSFHFTKEITLHMKHFSNFDTEQDTQRMAFLSAPTHLVVDKRPVYRFKALERGEFNFHSQHCKISLTHFCKITAGRKRKRSAKTKDPPTKKQKDENRYVYQVYQDRVFEDRAIFSTFLDHPKYYTELKVYVKENFPDFWAASPESVSILEDKISLQWPDTVATGWEVTSNRKPWLTKEQMDSINRWPYPPVIKLEVERLPTSGSYRSSISVTILGVENETEFTLKPKLRPSTSGSSSHYSVSSSVSGPLSPLSIQSPGSSLTQSLEVFSLSSQNQEHRGDISDTMEKVPPPTCPNRPKLGELLENVKAIEWYKLGLQLTENDHKLNIIETDHRNDSETALRKMFQFVLEEDPELSWEKVARAMRNIGLCSQAKTLEEKFCLSV